MSWKGNGIERVGICRRGSCGRGSHGSGNRGSGNRGKGSCKETQYERERETSIEPSASNNKSNNSDLSHKEINPNTVNKIIVDFERNNVTTIELFSNSQNEGSYQQQSKFIVSDLLQISDSNNSNDNINHLDYYQENYINKDDETVESPRRSNKLRSSNYMNEDDKTVELPKRRSDKLRSSNYMNKDDKTVESSRRRLDKLRLSNYMNEDDKTVESPRRKSRLSNYVNEDDEIIESSKKRTEKPDTLSDMTNILEICQWLVLQKLDVLATANKMHDAIYALLDSLMGIL
ncbi:hypothetical protein F8M41_023874 [Gigaspora margarita]|uniref:Uncharacterized protein n=1 Tax=Gigaspora margarita TaxID=4874 RepID=A0A8H4ACM6_GIGMA|nr:hypothetical protein F8M41_023874 [Gigaspora margarita]